MTSVLPEIINPICQKSVAAADNEIACTSSGDEEEQLEGTTSSVINDDDNQLAQQYLIRQQQSENGRVAKLSNQSTAGKFMLIHSCARGLKSSVEELSLDTNIDVNFGDSEGNTALIHAAQAGHTQIIELLIDRFAKLEIDHVNKLGQTALIKAAIQGRANCARLLLRAGADPYKRDNGRQLTAFEWAKFVGRTECGHVIKEFMEPRRAGDKHLPHKSVQNNFKQITCVASIPLIGDGVREVSALTRPRVRSAPPTSVVKIRITPPPSPPFCHALSPSSEGHPSKHFPFKTNANQSNCNNSSKRRPLRTEKRPKSSAL